MIDNLIKLEEKINNRYIQIESMRTRYIKYVSQQHNKAINRANYIPENMLKMNNEYVKLKYKYILQHPLISDKIIVFFKKETTYLQIFYLYYYIVKTSDEKLLFSYNSDYSNFPNNFNRYKMLKDEFQHSSKELRHFNAEGRKFINIIYRFITDKSINNYFILD